jgi:ABC-2 type transport system permease protein
MIDPLFKKSFTDLRGQMLGWGIGMGFMLALTVALYPSISEAYAGVLDQMPEGLMAFLGADISLDRLEGYINAEFFSYAPVVVAIFAILAGSSSLTSEVTEGTMDLLLAQPLSRVRAATMKLAALVAANVAMLAIMAVGLWLPLAFIDVDAAHLRIVNAFVLLIPFMVAVALASSLLAQLLGSRMFAGTLVAVVLVASYILEALGNLNTTIDAGRPLYVTVYYQGRQALVSEIEWGYLIPLVLAVPVMAAITVAVFDRRDIGANGVARLPRLWPKRSTSTLS